MSKRNDLKKRLKAADRRRNRRKASQSVPQDAANQGEPSLPQVNPADLIAEILVKYGREDKSPSDVAATAALRACLNGEVPSKEPARTLATTIESVARLPGVTVRAYRVALRDLLDAAKQHQGRRQENPDAFLAYLSILAEAV